MTPEQRRLPERFTRLEVLTGPNRDGDYSYFVYWMADYHPGHPDGEYRWRERGQIGCGPLPLPLNDPRVTDKRSFR